MKLAQRHYRPASNWITFALLAVLVIGFGVFADARVSVSGNQGIAAHTATQPTHP